MESSDRLEPLRHALAADPDNHRLRLILAESLAQDGRLDEAAAEYEVLVQANELPAEELLAAGQAAVSAGNYALGASIAALARTHGIVDGVADLLQQIDKPLGLLDATGAITFSDVGGLAEVKQAISRTIILPLQQADLYERYGRRSGGGVLLYGPPGCGKTLLARATAGECLLPFLNIRIEEILDPYFGVSERNLHDAFEQARVASPCVVFIDEIDAIGFARRKVGAGAGRPLVDQLLQELDAIGADNEGILILAATNAPWDVDEALKRPGRFDRTIFVPPPDEEARRVILDLLLRDRPTAAPDLARLARSTPLFSGADLMALVERATDAAIDDALASGTEGPVSMSHLSGALEELQPSTVEWIATARRYVEFANETGSYNDVRDYLSTKEARSWKSSKL